MAHNVRLLDSNNRTIHVSIIKVKHCVLPVGYTPYSVRNYRSSTLTRKYRSSMYNCQQKGRTISVNTVSQLLLAALAARSFISTGATWPRHRRQYKSALLNYQPICVRCPSRPLHNLCLCERFARWFDQHTRLDITASCECGRAMQSGPLDLDDSGTFLMGCSKHRLG